MRACSALRSAAAACRLRKVKTNNHHFYAYGTWKSFDDYLDHFRSKHIRRLRE